MANVVIPPKVTEVVVCGDNDEAGRKAAYDLANRIAAAGKTARVALPENAGEDWNDALRGCSASDIDGLKQQILDAEVIEPPEGLQSVTFAKLAAMKVPPRPVLLAPWLPAQGIAMIHAARGIGKTHLALGIACAVSTGKPFLGWQPDDKARALYIDGEMPVSPLQERVRAFMQYFGGTAWENIRILTPDIVMNGPIRHMPNLASDEGQQELDEVIARDDPALIIVDSISTLVRGGEENSAESWALVQDWSIRLRSEGRSVLFVHHSGKGGLQRGTSKREDIMDSVLGLKRPDGYSPEEGARFLLHYEKSRGFHGADASPMEISMRTEAGAMIWDSGPIKAPEQDRVREVAKEIANGTKQSLLARKLGLSKGRISQLVSEARARGYLASDEEAA